MISSLPFPIWNQRDPRWANQRLGTVNGTTIGQYGCLITAISMLNRGFDPSGVLYYPSNVDDLFTNQNGYANGNLVIWTAIRRILPNVAIIDHDNCASTPAPLGKIRDLLDKGGACILRVGFGGKPANMHWLLAVGYANDDIIFNDPWYGDQVGFNTRRYGTGIASADILEVYYFGDAIADPPVFKPEAPIAKLPAENPVSLPTLEPVVEPVPEPVEEPLPTPAPEPQIEKEPEPTPEWVTTWVHDITIPPQVVSVPVAAIVDVETGLTVGTLAQGERVKPLAGYFRANDVIYVRTQSALERGRWTGLRQLDIRDYQPPTGGVIDGIQAPVEQSVYEDVIETAATEIYSATKSVAELVFGLLSYPLRLPAIINKYLKRSN
jgi:hypothetical protein